MTENTAGEPVTQDAADEKQQTRRLAVFFAAIAASQAPGHLGYVAGMDSMREARSLVVRAVTERHGRVVRTGDNIVIACLDDAAEALKAAITIQRSAVENRYKKAPLNIRIFIHFGERSITEEHLQRDLSTVVARMADMARFGHIYVSLATYNNVQGLNAVEFRPLGASESALVGHLPFYDVAWHPETDCTPGVASAESTRAAHEEVGPFVHGAALVAGRHAPCFYCGSRKHRTTACPSKRLPYATNGLRRLGDLSIDDINRLFSDYLRQAGEDLSVIPEPAPKEDQSLIYLAPWSFYELKRVFQLRFLDVVWNASPKAEWHKARQRRTEGSPEGGMLWLARDCIRTSRTEEAEHLLWQYGRRNSRDYRAPCGLAFVEIEKENYMTAAGFLNEALNQRVGNLQRTYLLLLLSRVYEFIPDPSRADEKLKDALAIERFCPEATFELIIRYFKERREADAANRLVKLIRVYREYYPAALISPELTRFHESTSPELEKLVAQTKAEAEKVVQEADREVEALKVFVGENDTDVMQVVSSHGQMRELLDKPATLLNYYDTIDLAGGIIASCKSLDRERAEHAATLIRNIEARAIESVQRSIQPRKALARFQPILVRVLRLKDGLQARAPLAPCLAQCEEMDREADFVQIAIKQMDARYAFLQMLTRLSRDIVLASFVTATIGLVLFPGVLSLLHTFRPEALPLEPAEIWLGQKAILLTGSLFAVILAALRALLSRRHPARLKSEG